MRIGDFYLAPGVGFEPTTKRLTVSCATAALPRIMSIFLKNSLLEHTPEHGDIVPIKQLIVKKSSFHFKNKYDLI